MNELSVVILPWVTRLKKPQPCRSLVRAPGKAYYGDPDVVAAYRAKHACKSPAYWKFRALKRSYAEDGVYCWAHLIFHGVYGDSMESDRTGRWLSRHGYGRESEQDDVVTATQ